jgi:hypothetical protein
VRVEVCLSRSFLYRYDYRCLRILVLGKKRDEVCHDWFNRVATCSPEVPREGLTHHIRRRGYFFVSDAVAITPLLTPKEHEHAIARAEASSWTSVPSSARAKQYQWSEVPCGLFFTATPLQPVFIMTFLVPWLHGQ